MSVRQSVFETRKQTNGYVFSILLRFKDGRKTKNPYRHTPSNSVPFLTSIPNFSEVNVFEHPFLSYITVSPFFLDGKIERCMVFILLSIPFGSAGDLSCDSFVVWRWLWRSVVDTDTGTTATRGATVPLVRLSRETSVYGNS